MEEGEVGEVECLDACILRTLFFLINVKGYTITIIIESYSTP